MPKNDFNEKFKILTPLQKLPKNVGDLGKLIVAKGFKKLPKVQKIATSGHTAPKCHLKTYVTLTTDQFIDCTSAILPRPQPINVNVSRLLYRLIVNS